MTPTLSSATQHRRAAPLHLGHSAPEPLADDELLALKRDLAAAKERFLQLAHSAERARRASEEAETQARARLAAAIEILTRARSEPVGPALDHALAALRSHSASLPPASASPN